MSGNALVSTATRFVAAEKNAVVEPSALMSGSVLAPLACPPALSTLTRTVVPVFATAEAASMWLAEHPQGRLMPVRDFHAEARRLVERLEHPPTIGGPVP